MVSKTATLRLGGAYSARCQDRALPHQPERQGGCALCQANRRYRLLTNPLCTQYYSQTRARLVQSLCISCESHLIEWTSHQCINSQKTGKSALMLRTVSTKLLSHGGFAVSDPSKRQAPWQRLGQRMSTLNPWRSHSRCSLDV